MTKEELEFIADEIAKENLYKEFRSGEAYYYELFLREDILWILEKAKEKLEKIS